jgi:hypothetical protein
MGLHGLLQGFFSDTEQFTAILQLAVLCFKRDISPVAQGVGKGYKKDG